MLDTVFPIMQLSSVFQLDTSCLGTTQIFQTPCRLSVRSLWSPHQRKGDPDDFILRSSRLDQAPLRPTEDMIQLFDWLSSTLNE